MTLQELSRLYLLKGEREKLHRQWAMLRAESSGIGSPRLDGMPKGAFGRGSKAERYAIRLADLDAAISEKDIAIAREEIALYRFIASVPDSKARLIMALRFVDCLTWDRVARSVGGDPTEWKAKKYCYRYLEKAESTSDDAP